MNEKQVTDILEAYEHKLEQSRLLNMQSQALNIKFIEELNMHKAKSKLHSVIRLKSWLIVFGILWVLFLSFLVSHSLTPSKIFFVISAGMIALITAIGIAVYIHHIILIHSIDNSASIVEAQEQLARLQASTLNSGRILFLQLPFYSTFFFTPQWIATSPLSFWLIAFPVALVFAAISIWLFRNISLKNAHKKWFRFLFSSSEWTSVTKAIEFMDEISEFRKAGL